MFRKYEKTYRIIIPQFDVKGKFTLSKADTKLLLGGKVTITEKLDGANVGLIRHKDTLRLQKRGSLVDRSEHEQFNFFRDWAMRRQDVLMKLPKNTVTYMELLRCVHTVYYDKLPDWCCVFNIWNKRYNEYLSFKEVTDICADLGLYRVPKIFEGHTSREELVNFIPKISKYGSQPAEGIVIINHRQQTRGKVVRPEFIKDIEDSDHWRNKPIKFNKLQET